MNNNKHKQQQKFKKIKLSGTIHRWHVQMKSEDANIHFDN